MKIKFELTDDEITALNLSNDLKYDERLHACAMKGEFTKVELEVLQERAMDQVEFWMEIDERERWLEARNAAPLKEEMAPAARWAQVMRVLVRRCAAALSPDVAEMRKEDMKTGETKLGHAMWDESTKQWIAEMLDEPDVLYPVVNGDGLDMKGHTTHRFTIRNGKAIWIEFAEEQK